jgi:hypothetical protein
VQKYPRDTVGQFLHERAQMRIVTYNRGRHVTLRVVSIVGTALEALVTLVRHQALRSICFASRQVGKVPDAPSDRSSACVCDGVLVGSLN